MTQDPKMTLMCRHPIGYGCEFCRRAAPAPVAAPAATFQARVQPWMLACFGAEIAADRQERNHRFLEEALELVQACGATASEAHQLVDYVYGRPVGEKQQEVGGVMVTLAALCLAQGLDMHAAGETELARIWTKVEQIRAKQAAKPKHSPLPEHVPAEPAHPDPQGVCMCRSDNGVHSADCPAIHHRQGAALSDGWIAVADRLPTAEKDYLVKGIKHSGLYHDVAGLFHGKWMSQVTQDECKFEVSHWMPLPTDESRASSSRAEVESAAASDVLAERRRQVEAEGWTPEHDDKHEPGELAAAAGCYAIWGWSGYAYSKAGEPPKPWPWDEKWWKPADLRRQCVKAGALILAAIERIDRLAAAEAPNGEGK